MVQQPSFALIGECMIELREPHGGRVTRSYGGDVLNTAVYLARLMGDTTTVRFTTVLGDDPFSAEMIASWENEGILCDTVGRLSEHNAGLYFVKTDHTGERTFHYWRDQSAARDIMSDQWAAMLKRAMDSDWIYFSGITLAILNDNGRERLLSDLIEAKSNGAQIVFDGNFRPSLWRHAKDARNWHMRAWKLCDLALAGAEDEAQVFGDATPKTSLERLKEYGIPEICVKCGFEPLRLYANNKIQTVKFNIVNEVVDTTAAGDSFNAGYLAARLHHKSSLEAAQFGAILAAEVIKHPGAVIHPTRMPKLM